MRRIVSDEALDILFRAARSRHGWLQRPVSDTLLRALWELVRVGPCGGDDPVRIAFLSSEAARARLDRAIPAAERAAIEGAPVVAIVAGRTTGRDDPASDDPASDDPAGDAERDAALHAAYLIVAARALGLDCGPVWHFDRAALDGAFFAGGAFTARFVCALGYGEDARPPVAGEPRRDFDAACRIL